MENVKKLSRRLKITPPTYYKQVSKEEVKDMGLNTFIKKIFQEWNSKYSSYRVKSGDEASHRNAYRSMHDIFAICKYYGKASEPEQVVRELIQLTKEKVLKGYWVCHTIKKYVFQLYPGIGDQLRVGNISFTGAPIKMEDVVSELGFNIKDFQTSAKRNW